MGVILIFVGISAFFHHQYPSNQLLRFFDWFSSFVLMAYTLMAYKLTGVEYLLFLILFSIWIFSFYHFHKTHNIQYYSISHIAWHILGAASVLLVVV